MVSKIEVGATGARFSVIERLATALTVDPAEFFTTEIPSGMLNRKALAEITSRLALLSEPDLTWAKGLLEAGLRPRSAQVPGTASGIRARKVRPSKR